MLILKNWTASNRILWNWKGGMKRVSEGDPTPFLGEGQGEGGVLTIGYIFQQPKKGNILDY